MGSLFVQKAAYCLVRTSGLPNERSEHPPSDKAARNQDFGHVPGFSVEFPVWIDTIHPSGAYGRPKPVSVWEAVSSVAKLAALCAAAVLRVPSDVAHS